MRTTILSLTTLAIVAVASAFTGATPAVAADACPNAAIRLAQDAGHLPDCRAYEQVTPAVTGNQSYSMYQTPPPNLAQAGIGGNRFKYLTVAQFPVPGVQMDGSNYLATRSTTGWTNQNIDPAMSTTNYITCIAQYPVASPDLTKQVLGFGFYQPEGCGTDDPPLIPGEPHGVGNLFLRDGSTGSLDLISPMPATGPPADANFSGASPDLSHVFFTSSARLTSNAINGQNLYDWSRAGLRLTGIVNGSPVSGAKIGDGDPRGPRVLRAVSDDGEQVVFTVGGKLYLRKNGTTTIQLDASVAGGPGGGARYLTASTDGRKVFFSDDAAAELTSDTVPGSGQNLYVYDRVDGLKNLTAGATDARVIGTHAGMTSEDGSYLYFVAEGALTMGATAGQANLYLAHAGHLQLVATLDNPADHCNWSFNFTGNSPQCITQYGPGARVTPDGHRLIFTSVKSLTGYDNVDPDTGQPHHEVFAYDVGSAGPVCVSCRPDGSAPTGDAWINGVAGSYNSPDYFYLPRSMSADGRRIFFSSDDALVPADSNGKTDIYEYTAGKVSLLTTGTGQEHSLMIDTTPSGNDVFVATYDRLVGQDKDGAADVYDVRVAGGIAAQNPAPKSPACQGTSCRGPIVAGPVLAAPSSAAFVAPWSPPAPAPGAARTATLRVSGIRTARGSSTSIKVKVPGKGRVRTSGRGLRRSYKTVKNAKTYKVKVRLSKRSRSRLRRRHKVKVRVTVRFTPAAGTSLRKRVHMTFRQRSKHRKSSSRTAHRSSIRPTSSKKGR